MRHKARRRRLGMKNCDECASVAGVSVQKLDLPKRACQGDEARVSRDSIKPSQVPFCAPNLRPLFRDRVRACLKWGQRMT